MWRLNLSTDQQTPWLHKQGKRRVFTLKLTNVPDPLDADAIWNQSTSGNDRNMLDSEKQRSDLRLKQALKAHQYMTVAYHGRAPERHSHVFADVVVWIPAQVWRDAHINQGEALFYMAERFRYQHTEDFRGYDSFQGRPPNYAIMPHADLAYDEVICQFGMGVFLPNKNDTLTATVKLVKRGYEPATLPDWIFFEPHDEPETDTPAQPHSRSHQQISRPAALYYDQSMLLISKTLLNSPLQSPLWLDSYDEGELIINMRGSHTTETTSYGDDEYILAKPAQRIGKQSHCQFYAAQNLHDAITLLLDRDIDADTAKQHSQTTHGNTTGTVIIDGGDVFDGLSRMDFGEENQPDYIFQLKVTGIILPRLDGLRNAGSLTHWLLYLDSDGLPCPTEQASWVIKGARQASHLQWQHLGDEAWQILEPNSLLPYPNHQATRLDKPELSKSQFAILPLNTQADALSILLPLAPEQISIGRDLGENNHADIVLGLLNESSCLMYEDGSQRGNLAAMGLSAKHLQAGLKGRHLQVSQLSKSQTLVIQQQGGIRQTLSPHSQHTLNDELRHKESLIMGPFRLQFMESFLPDLKD